MKVLGTAGLLWAGLAAGWAGTAGFAAEDVKVGASADVSALSAYVWRGQVLNDESVVQPAVTITKGGFAINAWGNFNLTDAVTGDSRGFSEVDLTASYGHAAGRVALSASLIEYIFPNQTLVAADGTGEGYPGTREIYLGASLPNLTVTPALTVYYDFGEVDSFYGLCSLGYSAKLKEALSLGLSASLAYAAAGYNAFYFGVDDAAFNDASLGASLTWVPCDGLAVTPAFQYVKLIDSDIENAAASLYRDKQQSVASLKCTYTF